MMRLPLITLVVGLQFVLTSGATCAALTAPSRVFESSDSVIAVAPAGIELATALDSLQVERHWLRGPWLVDWRTGERNGENPRERSHCSAFVAAAADRFGVYLLRPPAHPSELLANAQAEWLNGSAGLEAGWRQVSTAVEAQQLANQGSFVVAVYQNPAPRRPGHIAVVRPAEITAHEVQGVGPQITQAGFKNYSSTNLSVGFARQPGAWTSGAQNAVQFFVNVDANRMAPRPATGPVKLRYQGELVESPSRTFVVTHGYNGTAAGDRFQLLAWSLKESYPTANVYLLDWSPLATARGFLGTPNPWAVSGRIDAVGQQAVKLLRDANINPAQVTLIGESFGVYVNHQVAHQLGGVALHLACNPAHEAGGYLPPDLRSSAARSVAFVADTPFDTRAKIAARTLHLELPEELLAADKHTAGVALLTSTLEAGNHTWIDFDIEIPMASPSNFDGAVAVTGEYLTQQSALAPRRPVQVAGAASGPMASR